MESLIGKTIDNYRILEVIGRGGMGVVLKALDTSLEKIVALKMIDPFLAKDENFVRRFKTEAKALARLENPNIVTVHALRDTDSGFFMVMEYVESQTLSQHLLQKGPFSVKDTIKIIKQLLNAIGHAHKVGVIHRDIKPSNVFLCYDGKIKVIDFGLAKVAQQSGLTSTVAQTRAGTLYYMSPEQVKGLKNVDMRSDIYSLGMTIYEILTGRLPFEKTDSDFTIQKKIVEGEIPSPALYKRGIPKPLLKFILKSIERDPEKRFQSISEMEEAIFQIEKEADSVKINLPAATKPIKNNREKSFKWNKKLIIVSTSIVLVLAVTIIIYYIVNSFITKEKNNFISQGIANADTSIVNKSKNDLTDFIQLASLTIKSNPPGAIVFLDGIQQKGLTDLHIDSLEIKDYLIALKLKGYEDWSSSYTLTPGSNSVSSQLIKRVPVLNATLVLGMDEEGEIFIDGKKYSVEANKSISEKVSPTKHLIRFVNKNNINKEFPINMEKQKQKEINCFFQHVVSIQTIDEADRPIWASINLNDEKTGLTTPTEITLSAGTHRINVRREGYLNSDDAKIIEIAPAITRKTIQLVFQIKKK